MLAVSIPDLSEKQYCVKECETSDEILNILKEFSVSSVKSGEIIYFICRENEGHVGLLSKITSSLQSVNKFNGDPFYCLGIDISGKKFVGVKFLGPVNSRGKYKASLSE